MGCYFLVIPVEVFCGSLMSVNEGFLFDAFMGAINVFHFLIGCVQLCIPSLQRLCVEYVCKVDTP